MSGRDILTRLGVAVPLDGQMHVTWLGRTLDRIGLGHPARALGIGFVPEHVLKRWACEREQAALDAYTAAINTLSHYAPAVARSMAAENADRGVYTQPGYSSRRTRL